MKKSFFILVAISLFFLLPGVSLAYVNEQFVPYKGYSTISEDFSSRYSQQYMYWRTGGLAAFDSWNDTYEHETVFYNYDGSAYATTATSWQSNLPDPYMDTQAFDGNNEYNIAVGTFDPTDISASTWYNYFVRLDDTESYSSYYKISGQKGYSLCELGAWCVANEQTATLIPFKSPLSAPEANRDYRYEWESNNSISYADRISLGDWGTGVIDSSSDQDYFVFNVPSSRTVDFILKLSQLGGSIDYDITIYNSSGNYVTSSASGAGQDEIFSYYLSSGDYYARIFPYSGSNSITTYSFIPY